MKVKTFNINEFFLPKQNIFTRYLVHSTKKQTLRFLLNQLKPPFQHHFNFSLDHIILPDNQFIIYVNLFSLSFFDNSPPFLQKKNKKIFIPLVAPPKHLSFQRLEKN